MATEETCQGCRFWARAGSRRGHCRRHAPAMGRFGHATWPETAEGSWCRSFKKAAPSVEGANAADAAKEA
jgi:hypothetical protein